MQINSITNGIVIDHIRAGTALKVIKHLNIRPEKGGDSVAVIMNVVSEKHGRKDIIKLANVTNVNIDVLGLIDHNATVIYIDKGKVVKKLKLAHPQIVRNVFECKKPRCVVSIEEVDNVFHLVDESGKYRCEYCDNIVTIDDMGV